MHKNCLYDNDDDNDDDKDDDKDDDNDEHGKFSLNC